jgi:hypothetical protein
MALKVLSRKLVAILRLGGESGNACGDVDSVVMDDIGFFSKLGDQQSRILAPKIRKRAKS